MHNSYLYSTTISSDPIYTLEKRSQHIDIPETLVTSKIFIVRNKKIMLDRDLAELYEVETRVLNQAVNRNIERFPKEFMLIEFRGI